jgi:hypothetical protein
MTWVATLFDCESCLSAYSATLAGRRNEFGVDAGGLIISDLAPS